VRPVFEAPMLLLAFAVAVWIAGFDMLYACQDVDFDRREGLYSIPANYGVAAGLTTARIFHGAMVVALIALGLILGLGWPYYIGLALTAALLVYEHSLVNPNDLSKINVAFFNVNGYIAMTLFVFTLASLYV
jgi:4-hydroxybenzoate polyprenyltransferase